MDEFLGICIEQDDLVGRTNNYKLVSKGREYIIVNARVVLFVEISKNVLKRGCFIIVQIGYEDTEDYDTARDGQGKQGDSKKGKEESFAHTSPSFLSLALGSYPCHERGTRGKQEELVEDL